jgi:NADP-dependent 3-hydroxy acid dehydrogenase YdfG
MSNHVKDKVIIVTGAASGFGKLVSEKVSKLGAHLVATDVNEAGLEELLGSLQAAGHSAITVTADTSNREQMNHVAQSAINEFGRIDVLLNNAGIMPLGFYSDHHAAADAWDKCIDINFRGVLNGITAVYDQMIAQNVGHVVNMSSIYGNFPVAGAAVYGATKAAVNYLSDSLRVESQGRIKVTTIRPTGVPGTALGAGIINPRALAGILGANNDSYMEKFQALVAGELPDKMTDPENIEYYALDPELVADQIVFAINQPWGVSISDLTVRASGDSYVV